MNFNLMCILLALAIIGGSTIRGTANLLVNGGFEEGISGWRVPSSAKGAADFVDDTVYNGKFSVKLSCPTPGYVGLIQKVSVAPYSVYQLTAYIKTENVSTGRWCVNMGREDYQSYYSSQPLKGSQDWRKISTVVYSTDKPEMEIACRLGRTDDPVSGMAWFDDVVLTKLPITMFNAQSPTEEERNRFDQLNEAAANSPDLFAVIGGRHVALRIHASRLAIIKNPWAFVGKLDEAYDAYVNLTGFRPYNGSRIIYQEVYGLQHAAVSGQDVMMMAGVFNDAFKRFNKDGSIHHVFLHEMSHDFDRPVWNWNAELFANFKAACVVEMLGIKTTARNYGFGQSTGESLEQDYKEMAESRGYDEKISWPQCRAWGELEYHHLQLKDKIGLEPFKQTFHFLQAKQSVPNEKAEVKFIRFARLLQQYSRQDLVPWLAERGFPTNPGMIATAAPVFEDSSTEAQLKEIKDKLDKGLIDQETYERMKQEVFNAKQSTAEPF